MESSVKNSGVYWVLYLLLCLATFSIYMSSLGSIGLIVFIFAYILRYYAKKNGQNAAAAHASWQINTVWLTLLIWVLMIAAIIAFALALGLNETIMAELNKTDGSKMSPGEFVQFFWQIPGSKLFLLAVVILGLLGAFWPLKRALHGMLALCCNVEPKKLGSIRWFSLLVAVLIQSLAAYFLL